MDMNDALQLALKYYQDGNLLQADDIFKEIAKQNENAEILHILGIISSRLGRYDSAIEYYRKALQYHTGNAVDTYVALGAALQQKGLTEEAVCAYQKSIDLEPDNSRVRYILGNIYKGKGLIEETLRYYKEAIRMDPNYAEVYLALADTYQQIGQLDEAIEYYKKALQLNSSFVSAHYGLADIFQKKLLFDEANAHYERAMQLQTGINERDDNLSSLYTKDANKDLGDMAFIGDLSKQDATVLIEYTKKASSILEFGAGGSTQIICKNKNKSVRFVSIDTLNVWIDRTKDNLALLSIDPDVSFYLYKNWEQLIEGMSFDLIFDDGFEDLRTDFALKAWRYLKVGGSLLIHDTRTRKHIRDVEAILDHYYLGISSLLVNTNHSNITVIKKKTMEPYSNWNIDENKQPWEFGHGHPPKELWKTS